MICILASFPSPTASMQQTLPSATLAWVRGALSPISRPSCPWALLCSLWYPLQGLKAPRALCSEGSPGMKSRAKANPTILIMLGGQRPLHHAYYLFTGFLVDFILGFSSKQVRPKALQHLLWYPLVLWRPLRSLWKASGLSNNRSVVVSQGWWCRTPWTSLAEW